MICSLFPYLASSFSIPPKAVYSSAFTSQSPNMPYPSLTPECPFHMAKLSSAFQILPQMCLFQDVFLIPSWLLWAPSGHSPVYVFCISLSISPPENRHFFPTLFMLPGCFLFNVGKTARYQRKQKIVDLGIFVSFSKFMVWCDFFFSF